jgi:chitosanase
MTELQKRTVKAIVNVFETGRILGRYDAVTVLQGDTGHLSYGISQASLGSGSLYLMIQQYCESGNAAFSARLTPYLPKLRERDVALDQDRTLQTILRKAGGDPVMRRVQDDFFERKYWQPAARAAASLHLSLPLCASLVYDGHIHGSFGKIRGRVKTALPQDRDEKAWAAKYVELRKIWLLSCAPPLPATVYRMEEFARLIQKDRWDLALPLKVRGVAITESALAPLEPAAVKKPADVPRGRVLKRTRPRMKGDDIREIQRALRLKSFVLDEDGAFGPSLEAAVKQFQKDHGLKPDGVIRKPTRAAILSQATRVPAG